MAFTLWCIQIALLDTEANETIDGSINLIPTVSLEGSQDTRTVGVRTSHQLGPRKLDRGYDLR